MKGLFERMMTYLAAAAYAEAGEFDGARAMLQEKEKLKKRDVRQDRLRVRPTAPGQA